MGPRSYERGNPTKKAVRTKEIIVLQWGRVLMNAEIREVKVKVK